MSTPRRLSDIHVRPAVAADLDELVRLEEVNFTSDRFHRRQLDYLVRRARGRVLVLDAGTHLAGSTILTWRRGGRTARLYSIAVDPRYRGLGLGRLLLEVSEAEALANGLERISLEVRPDNRAAIALYLESGYAEVGRLPDYYEDGSHALKMARSLRRATEAGPEADGR